MNNQQQQQQQQGTKSKVPGFLDRYMNSTGVFMDGLGCFACGSTEQVVMDDCFDAVSTAPSFQEPEPSRQQQQQPQQQPHHGPALFASYDLEDFSSTDHSMHRPPIDNRYNYYEHATTTPTKSAQVLLRPRPLRPSSSMLLQFSNNSILDKGGEGDDSSRDAPSVRQHSNAFRKVASSSSYSSTDRYPEISPADTYTTVSLSQELEDDYDSDDDHDLHSQASTELVSHLFRKKEGFKSNNEEDHEAYGYLLRMKTQNYIHSSTEEQQQEHQQHEESDDTNRLRFVYRETLPPLMPEF